MADELLCNIHRVKIKIYLHDFFLIFHSSTFTIDSYGDNLIAILMEIYHELGEEP